MRAWKIVPYNADSMAYHCARILHWIQNRTVDYYPTNVFTQLHSPPMAEYVVMQTYFLFDSDVAFNLVQWYACTIDAAPIYFICRKLNVQREVALVKFPYFLVYMEKKVVGIIIVLFGQEEVVNMQYLYMQFHLFFHLLSRHQFHYRHNLHHPMSLRKANIYI